MLQNNKNNTQKQKSSTLYIFFLLLLAFLSFGMARQHWGLYSCMRNHYPDKFIEITMINPNSEEEDVGVFDRGKAIYPRTYVYGNIRYSTKITAKEFDDTFYICEDDPSQEYSETDLRHPAERLGFAITFSMAGIVSTLWATCEVIRSLIRKKNKQ